MDLSERVGHTLVLGTTRVGKTRLAELLITQDIRRGEVVIVFDPKGDASLLRGSMPRPNAPGAATPSSCFTWATRRSRRGTTRWAASRASPKCAYQFTLKINGLGEILSPSFFYSSTEPA
jgi:hypothetical protein